MKKLSEEAVKAQFKEKHGDYYDYSKFVYVNNTTKGIIICPKHGEFKQTAKRHKVGEGCPKCGYLKMTGRPVGIILGKEDFVRRAIIAHNGNYNYDNLVFTRLKHLTTFTCPIHGDFQQTPRSHQNGRGCRKCGYESMVEKINKKTFISQESYIERCKKIHNNKYDYSKVNYFRMTDKLTIICPKHGEFKQVADYHISGRGCKKCGYSTSLSKNEKELGDFIKSLGFKINTNDRELLEGNELDIVISSKKLAVEYNGIYWHSEAHKDKYYHRDKTNQCKEKAFQLIHIFANVWRFKKDLVKSFLKAKLGIFDKKLHGRKCMIQEIPYSIASEFYDRNHLQGKVSATTHLGLYLDKRLVTVMSFKKKEEGVYDLNRFCSKTGYLVRGGFSKLLKHFIKNNQVSKIISFSDNTYSDGGLYKNNGFTKVKDLPVDYKYIWGKELKHKFGFRKKKLAQMFDNTEGKTEHEICLENNVLRVYDAGKQKFELNIQK